MRDFKTESNIYLENISVEQILFIQIFIKMGQLKFGLISFIVSVYQLVFMEGQMREGRKKMKAHTGGESTLSTTIESEPDLKSTFINRSPFAKAIFKFLCLFSDRCS